MNNEIFESYKPELEKRFKDNVYRTFKNIVEALGPEMKNVYNDWNWAKPFSNVLAPVVRNVQKDHYGMMVSTNVKEINEEKLNEYAAKYADDTIKAWKLKIDEKVGMLDDGKVHHLDGCRFSISGTKEGHEVYIHQDMIVNISGKGTLFNQFPARIKMDGKAISAKKFKDFFKKS